VAKEESERMLHKLVLRQALLTMASLQLAFILALLRCYLQISNPLGYEKQRPYCDYLQKYEKGPSVTARLFPCVQLAKDLI